MYFNTVTYTHLVGSLCRISCALSKCISRISANLPVSMHHTPTIQEKFCTDSRWATDFSYIQFLLYDILDKVTTTSEK